MDALTIVRGVAAPMLQVNVDTDQIAPGHAIMKMEKAGAGVGLFANWRYREDQSENPDFVLNQPPFRHASFLVAGANFGCGSSREFAAWALRDFGIRAVIAPSFGAIFASNCYINGILPLSLPERIVAEIGAEISETVNEMTIDLIATEVVSPAGHRHRFEVPELQREMLLEGLDAVGLTLRHADLIAEFQKSDRDRRPWIYNH